MQISEKELNDYLSDNPQKLNLCGDIYNEFHVPGYGYIDILSIRQTEKYVICDVVELKITEFKANQLSQLFKYCSGIDYFVGNLLEKKILKINPICVFKETENIPMDYYLMEFIKNVKFYEFSFDNDFKIKIEKRNWGIYPTDRPKNIPQDYFSIFKEL